MPSAQAPCRATPLASEMPHSLLRTVWMNTTHNTIDKSAVLLETSSQNAKLVSERRSCSRLCGTCKEDPDELQADRPAPLRQV